jgi:hypothetical protein
MDKHRIKLATVALAATGLAAASVGTAFAAQGSATATPPATPAAGQPAPQQTVVHRTVTPKAQPSPDDQSGTETATAENGTEVEAPDDGPGGHEDPPGKNVDHQFQGVE